MKTTATAIITTIAAFTLTACQYSHPSFTPVNQGVNQSMQQPAVSSEIMFKKEERRAAGSLWRTGSNSFFKDSRARKLGDIVTVIISENAKAEVDAKTEASRVNTDTIGITNLLNLEGLLTNRGMPPSVSSLLDTDSNRDFQGEGKTDREDKFSGRIAATVVQVLPNGYMVIRGQREVVINYELQEMLIQGIIRPVDIGADNTIPSEKIAEARISYAGRGIINKTQQPQYGTRFLDKWLPF